METAGNNTLNGRLDKIEATLSKIETALLGNEFKKSGYLDTVDKLEQRVEKLEKAQQAQLWFFLGAGGIGGAGLVKLIESLFNH